MFQNPSERCVIEEALFRCWYSCLFNISYSDIVASAHIQSHCWQVQIPTDTGHSLAAPTYVGTVITVVLDHRKVLCQLQNYICVLKYSPICIISINIFATHQTDEGSPDIAVFEEFLTTPNDILICSFRYHKFTDAEMTAGNVLGILKKIVLLIFPKAIVSYDRTTSVMIACTI